MSDPFETLGLPDTATLAEVEAAWKRLAGETHPDKPGGSAHRFIEVREAYREAKEIALERLEPQPCETCRGTGRVRQTFGFSSIEVACETCEGSGKVPGQQ